MLAMFSLLLEKASLDPAPLVYLAGVLAPTVIAKQGLTYALADEWRKLAMCEPQVVLPS